MARRQRNRSATKDEDESKQQQEQSTTTRRPLKRNRIAVAAPVQEEKSFFPRASSGGGNKAKRARSTTTANNSKETPTPVVVERTWEDWKEIYLVGTEWYAYDSVYEMNWDFDHLRRQLNIHEDHLDEEEEQDGESGAEENGEKKEKLEKSDSEKIDEMESEGKNVFVFGSTEPQMLDGHLRHIPVLIVVVGTISPPSRIGINSVQMEQEEILDMKQMKMSWVPYIPRSQQNKVMTRKNQTNIYFLHCSQRRSALKRMKEMDVRRYEYALPYFIRPSKFLNDADEGTEVNFVYAPDGKRAMNLNFDWDMDDRNDWIKETCENNELEYEKFKEPLMNELKNQVLAAKKAIADRKKERQDILDAIPDEEKQALDDMKFYKFYPQKPDVSNYKSSYINRYYGHATKTFP